METAAIEIRMCFLVFCERKKKKKKKVVLVTVIHSLITKNTSKLTLNIEL